MSTTEEQKKMDPIEQMRHQVCEELQGSVTIVGKVSFFFLLFGSGDLFFSVCFWS